MSCPVVGCGRPIKVKGLCTGHAERLRLTGDVRTDVPLRAYRTGTCSIEGCDKLHEARGYCGYHYQALRTRGDPLGFSPRFKHGLWSTPTYMSWRSMKQRCLNPKVAGYQSYGGRGITVCERWRDSFENFLVDMGERPKGKTIDRRDVNGNYEADNCQWATPKEQSANRRMSVAHV